MTFRTFFLLSLLPACLACNSKEKKIAIVPDVEKNHLQRNHIKGKVKNLAVSSYYIPEQETRDTTCADKVLLSKSIQYYSPDGYLTRVLTLNKNGDTISRRKISYDGDARQQYWTLSAANGTVLDSCHYDYDISGFLASEERFSEDSLIYQATYQTDAVGNVIAMRVDRGAFATRHTMQYNPQGLLIRTDEFTPDNRPFKFTTIEYDNYGDEVNRRVFKRENQIIEYTYTQYDEQGRLLAKIYEDRMRNYREDYQYPAHDYHGNWTVERRKIGNDVTHIRERAINYY